MMFIIESEREAEQLRDTIKEKDDKITATEVSLQQQLGDKDKTIATLQGWNNVLIIIII